MIYYFGIFTHLYKRKKKETDQLKRCKHNKYIVIYTLCNKLQEGSFSKKKKQGYRDPNRGEGELRCEEHIYMNPQCLLYTKKSKKKRVCASKKHR